MRLLPRAILVVSALAVAGAVSGCANFDPDKLDVFGWSEKKKLPGDRKAVFPEGVPGVTQGVPPELIKGHQPPPETANAVPPAPEKAVAEKPAPKPKLKRAERAPAQPAAQTQRAWPSQPQAAQAPWPAQSQQQPAQPAWPEPQSSGNVSR